MLELNKLLEKDETKIPSLEIKISSENTKEIQELIQFFKTHSKKFEVSQIKLDFSSQISSTERSAITLGLLKIAKHVTGIQHLILECSIKDYVLEAIFNNEAFSHLIGLKFKHEEEKVGASRKMINTIHLFEESLVGYLQKNPVLESLQIDDYLDTLETRQHPKFKAAMMQHPKLIEFKTNFFEIGSNPSLLKNNTELQAAFANKIQRDPAVIKKQHAHYFNNKRKEITSTLNRFDTPTYALTSWAKRTALLNSWLETWKEIKTIYDAFTPEEADNLDQKKAIATAFTQYLQLLKTAAHLRTLSEASKEQPHKSTLELFWDITRPKLWEKIHAALQAESVDFSAILVNIEKEQQALQQINVGLQQSAPIKSRQPKASTYPASYTAITAKEDDGFEKAIILLKDYTKNNSALSRFFHGHWNRHHVSEITNLLSRIQSNEPNTINDLDALKTALQSIKLVNQEGSLAHRIGFINSHCSANQNNSSVSAPLIV